MFAQEAAEAASNGGADWAVAAALVAAGAAIVSIPVNLYISHRRLQQAREESTKRLAHEERMLDKRLVHERREASRTLAAESWAKATWALGYLNADMVLAIASDGSGNIRTAAQEAVTEAMKPLGVMAALGWDERVQQAAADVHKAVGELRKSAFAAADRINDVSDPGKLGTRLAERVNQLQSALEEYRLVITED